MITDINVNGIGDSLESLLEARLKKENIPTCFGNMSPPLLKIFVKMDVDTLFKMRYDIPEDEKVEDFNLEDLTDLEEYKGSKRFAIDLQGFNSIDHIKKEMVNNYVEHIKNCISCKFEDICYKITTCYLLSLNINIK